MAAIIHSFECRDNRINILTHLLIYVNFIVYVSQLLIYRSCTQEYVSIGRAALTSALIGPRQYYIVLSNLLRLRTVTEFPHFTLVRLSVCPLSAWFQLKNAKFQKVPIWYNCRFHKTSVTCFATSRPKIMVTRLHRAADSHTVWNAQW